MKKSLLRTTMSLGLGIAMLVSCCSCTAAENETSVTTEEPNVTEETTPVESDDQTEATSDVEEPSDNDASGGVNEYGFEKHDFDKGVCKDCGKDWPTLLYEGVCRFSGAEPNGEWRVGNYHVNDGSGPNTNLEIASKGEGFMITYESKVEDDTSYLYTLRVYQDPFEDEKTMVFAVDFAISTHYNRISDHPDYPQITLTTTYEGNPEDLMKVYESGEIFTGGDDFIAYYDTGDDRKCYIPTSLDNDMTLEEMFEGEDPITPEEFKSIYLSKYKTFLSYIDEVMVNFNLPLSGYGIKVNE